MKFLKIFLIVFIVALLAFYIKNPASNYYVITGETMGSYYTIKINTSRENNILGKQIKEELESINQRISIFDNNSELSKINQAGAGVWIPVSDELAELFKITKKIYDMTGGAFDPTMGKVIDLWGFGNTKRLTAPTDEQIAHALKSSGFNKLEFSDDFKQVKKLNADITINLSAIIKGYSVDRVCELLEKEGYTDFIVDIGGELRAAGQRSDTAAGWNIGVADPQTKANVFVVSLIDSAAATSGDYENFYEVDGKKYSHTISPLTGRPVQSSIASVTIFREDCATADGLATALQAMGDKKAIDFANRNNVQTVIFMRTDNDTLSSTISDSAKKLVSGKNVSN